MTTTVYCYSHSTGQRPSMRLVDDTYEVQEGEHLSLGEPASEEEIEAWFPGSTLTVLQIAVASAATMVCNVVTNQVSTGLAMLTGYSNAAASVDTTGAPPSVEPGKSAFAALAAGNGMSAETLAALVSNMRAASMMQLGMLATLKGAVAAAQSASDLAKALAAFEATLAAQIAAINAAGLTTTVAVPPPILIAGVNA